MSFQLKTREQPENNIDFKTKQKIIDQLKSEVESLKAKYILDEKCRTAPDRNQTPNNNRNLINITKQSEEFSKTLPKKSEKNNFNYDLTNFSNHEKNNEFNFVDKGDDDDNYLEKDDSVIINDNHEANLYENFADPHVDQKLFNINNNLNIEQEEKAMGNLYPKEYKKGNLNLNNLNYKADKNFYSNINNNNNNFFYGNNAFSQSLSEKDVENLAKNNNYLNENDTSSKKLKIEKTTTTSSCESSPILNSNNNNNKTTKITNKKNFKVNY